MNNPCQICAMADTTVLYPQCRDYLSGDIFQLRQCPVCGCGETRRENGDPVCGDYYGTAYYSSEQGKFNPLLEKLFRLNHRRNAHVLQKRGHPQRVLEIGCGRAYILRELKSLGCEVHCLESADAADWIRNNPDVDVRSLPAGAGAETLWPWPDGYFDMLVLWHVFEHLPEPAGVLREARRVLADGGTLCLSVPNFASRQARLGGPLWFHLDVPRHLFHFTPGGLQKLLKYHGFSISEQVSGGIQQNLYGWWQTLANRLSPSAHNHFYRFLQGGAAWHATPHKARLAGQVAASPLWISAGLLAWLWEEFNGDYGSMTVYAEKQKS